MISLHNVIEAPYLQIRLGIRIIQKCYLYTEKWGKDMSYEWWLQKLCFMHHIDISVEVTRFYKTYTYGHNVMILIYSLNFINYFNRMAPILVASS